jgi:uncharacterized glyoxalase superfamily protein PhnB
MSDTQSRSSQVEVRADPVTAFTAFTDELDLWWVRGPINSYGAGKLVAMRCEPWLSSVDDVRVDVRFDPTENGTIVRLEATIPEGGSDRGGTAIIRVTPRWFGAWVAKRDATSHELHDLARFALTLHYARPAAAARWLAAAFGFESPDALPDGGDPLPEGEDGHPWIEFHVGNCSLIIDKLVGPPVDHTQLTHVPWVFVDDLEVHLARAQHNGATIVQGITSYGFTSYVALDIEGRSWRFAEARPTQPR